jgi:hypothetical protein
MLQAQIRRVVMAGLVPAIHVFLCGTYLKTWMPGTRPGMTAEFVQRQMQEPDRKEPEENGV